jgi:hypothetical protein
VRRPNDCVQRHRIRKTSRPKNATPQGRDAGNDHVWAKFAWLSLIVGTNAAFFVASDYAVLATGTTLHRVRIPPTTKSMAWNFSWDNEFECAPQTPHRPVIPNAERRGPRNPRFADGPTPQKNGLAGLIGRARGGRLSACTTRVLRPPCPHFLPQAGPIRQLSKTVKLVATARVTIYLQTTCESCLYSIVALRGLA